MARERLAFQADIALTLSGKNRDCQIARIELAKAAYGDDQKVLGELVGSITKMDR